MSETPVRHDTIRDSQLALILTTYSCL